MELNVNTCPGGKRAFTKSLPSISYNNNSLRFNQKACDILQLSDNSINRISFKIVENHLLMKWDMQKGFPVVFRKKDNVYSIHHRELITHFVNLYKKDKGLLLIGDLKDGYYQLTIL